MKKRNKVAVASLDNEEDQQHNRDSNSKQKPTDAISSSRPNSSSSPSSNGARFSSSSASSPSVVDQNQTHLQQMQQPQPQSHPHPHPLHQHQQQRHPHPHPHQPDRREDDRHDVIFPLEELLVFIVISLCSVAFGFYYFGLSISDLTSSSSSSSSSSHPLSSLFSSSSSSSSFSSSRVKDTSFTLRVSLESIYRGETVLAEFPGQQGRQSICSGCGGSGVEAGRKDAIEICSVCDGTGIQELRQHVGGGYFQVMRRSCPVCGGEGKKIIHPCHLCGGEGVRWERGELHVPIPVGAPNGHVITIRGAGHQSPHAEPGNVVITLQYQSHSVFQVREREDGSSDLVLKHKVTLKEALLGFKHRLKHLDGHMIVIERGGTGSAGSPASSSASGTTQKSGEVTAPGDILRIRGEGMPKHRPHSSSHLRSLFTSSRRWLFHQIGKERMHQWFGWGIENNMDEEREGENEKGDLVVEFEIIFPNKLKAAEVETVKLLLGD